MNTKTAIDNFLTSRQAKGLSPSAIKWYRCILNDFQKMYPKLPTKPEMIERFLISCAGGDERRHGYFRTLRALYNFLEKRCQVKNIVKLIDPPRRKHKKPKPITLDELDQLLSFPHPADITAGLIFMADCGARIGETVRLKPGDLNFTGYGYIARINGKTGERIVPISEVTYNTMLAVLPFHYSANFYCKLISRAFQEAHVKGTGHSIRHTFATYWKGDRHILKEILGHASITTTELYSGLLWDENSREHMKYSLLKLIQARKQIPLPFIIER
jgi:integrase